MTLCYKITAYDIGQL